MPRVTDLPDTFTELDEVLHGYIECALWSSTDDECYPLDVRFDADDLSDAARASMLDDVRSFVASNFMDCALYVQHRPADYLGHDLWLTRNRHGAGFWDRGLGELGDRLTDACRPMGESYLYVSDADTLEVSA